MQNIAVETTLAAIGEKRKAKTDFIHVVAAIIWHPSKLNTILISQRQKGKHLQHYWELPGGKLDSGESREQALNRELLEELNIEVLESKPFMEVKHCYSDRKILLDVWQVTAYSGEAEGCEGQKICWASIDELNDYHFPEADIPILQAIKNSVIA